MSRFDADDVPLPCTVGDLIRHLAQFPVDMPVIYQCYSDYSPLRVEDVTVVKAVPKTHYIMRAYEKQIPTMSAENRAAIQHFLQFPGN